MLNVGFGRRPPYWWPPEFRFLAFCEGSIVVVGRIVEREGVRANPLGSLGNAPPHTLGASPVVLERRSIMIHIFFTALWVRIKRDAKRALIQKCSEVNHAKTKVHMMHT